MQLFTFKIQTFLSGLILVLLCTTGKQLEMQINSQSNKSKGKYIHQGSVCSHKRFAIEMSLPPNLTVFHFWFLFLASPKSDIFLTLKKCGAKDDLCRQFYFGYCIYISILIFTKEHQCT